MASRYWRMAKTPLTLLLLLALLFFGYQWGMSKVTAPLPPKYVKPCIPTPINGGRLESTQVGVRVLNGSRLRGKAAEVAQQLRTAGFRVTRVGNAEKGSTKTKVIGFAPDAPEVKLVGRAFTNPELVGDQRADHSVEVLIGNDYQGMNREVPTFEPVTTPTLCLPEPPTSVE